MSNNLQNQKSIERKLKRVLANTNSDIIYNIYKGVVNLISYIGPIVETFYESLIIHLAKKQFKYF